MKSKYERMNKEEKRNVYKCFKEEKHELYIKMKRMFIVCYFGIFYGFLTFFYDCFFSKSKLNYCLDIIVFVFCIVSIIVLYKFKKNLLNKFVIENKKRF